MDFRFDAGPFPSLAHFKCVRNHQPDRYYPSLVGCFFDSSPVVFIDTNVLVDSFSQAVFFSFRLLKGGSCETFQAVAGAFFLLKQRSRTEFPVRVTPLAHSPAHPCPATHLRRTKKGSYLSAPLSACRSTFIQEIPVLLRVTPHFIWNTRFFKCRDFKRIRGHQFGITFPGMKEAVFGVVSARRCMTGARLVCTSSPLRPVY